MWSSIDFFVGNSWAFDVFAYSSSRRILLYALMLQLAFALYQQAATCSTDARAR